MTTRRESRVKEAARREAAMRYPKTFTFTFADEGGQVHEKTIEFDKSMSRSAEAFVSGALWQARRKYGNGESK